MSTATPQISDRVNTFLTKMGVGAGRLIFALDATMSRQPLWDTACRLQADMFAEASRIGGLEMQLVYYRGRDECRASRWTTSATELRNLMVRISCQAGETQIGKTLAHIRKQHAEQAVNAAVFIGDFCEEEEHRLYDAAAGLDVPVFMFQEGDDPGIEIIFREIARHTRGAYCKFSSGSAAQLGELLRCVASFAAGGRKALSNRNSESARLLLRQLKQ